MPTCRNAASSSRIRSGISTRRPPEQAASSWISNGFAMFSSVSASTIDTNAPLASSSLPPTSSDMLNAPMRCAAAINTNAAAHNANNGSGWRSSDQLMPSLFSPVAQQVCDGATFLSSDDSVFSATAAATAAACCFACSITPNANATSMPAPFTSSGVKNIPKNRKRPIRAASGTTFFRRKLFKNKTMNPAAIKTAATKPYSTDTTCHPSCVFNSTFVSFGRGKRPRKRAMPTVA